MSLPAARTAADTGEGPIYAAQGLVLLISRAWNLLRLNLRASMIVMLGPTLLLVLFSVLIAIPSSLPFLTPTPAHKLLLSLAVLVLSLVAFVLYCVFWIFSGCVLMRIYYSAIVRPAPETIAESWRFISGLWPQILILAVIGFLIGFVFGIIDFIILFLGILMSTAAFGTLSALLAMGQNPVLGIMTIFFLLLWGFVVLTVLIGLFTVQGFCFVFPFISLSTADASDPDAGKIWPHARQAARLLFYNLPRLVLFAVALFLFSLALSLTLNAPAYLWLVMEMARLGVSQQHALPLHVNVVLNLWASLVNLILMPFYISAITLFWYDCRVRKEGLDLRIWLDRILRRRGKNPRDYLAPAAS